MKTVKTGKHPARSGAGLVKGRETMSYGVCFYTKKEWVGTRLYLETEEEAREEIESWIAESPQDNGYELVEDGYIVEWSKK